MSAVAAKNSVTPSVTEPLEKKLSEIIHHFKRDWEAAKGGSRRLDVLWKYVEALEGLSQEFVQFVDLKAIDSWDSTALESASRLKEQLWDELEGLKLSIAPSSNLRGWWARCRQFFIEWISPTIDLEGHRKDRLMCANLHKTQKFLNFHFQNFQHQHTLYEQLSKVVDAKMGKMDEYPVFTSLPSSLQQEFRQLYRGLNLWEENLSVQGVPKDALIRLVQHICSPKQASCLFKDYSAALQAKLFDWSRHLKGLEAKTKVGTAAKDSVADAIAKQHRELHTLGATVEKYRKFLLCNDPDPYVRARGGFAEWTIGPEPPVAGDLVSETYAIEALDRLHKQFYSGLAGKPEGMPISAVQVALDALLHAMSQPLVSQSELQALAEQFVADLSSLGELFSTDPAVVPFMTDYLLKGMQHDSSSQALLEAEGFHPLYRTHMAILEGSEAHPFALRLKRLKKHLSAIKNWIKHCQGVPDCEAIAGEVAGIKRALLQFKMEASKSHPFAHFLAGNIAEQRAAFELLQYRYLFAEFFRWLRAEKPDDMLIRNQFLFVDQLLEANTSLGNRT